jgi:hypothetical protein
MAYTVGAAMAALIALVAGIFAGETLRGAPRLFAPLILTLFFVTGLCLAMAYIQFEYASTQITRRIQDGQVELDDELPADQQCFPRGVEGAERWWQATLFGMLITVLAFLIAVWWPLVSGSSEVTLTPSPTATQDAAVHTAPSH